MTPQQVLDLKQKIRELDAAATKGPWENWKSYSGDHELMEYRIAAKTNRHLAILRNYGDSPTETLATADFIAFAREALPTLLAYCEELEQEREWIWANCKVVHWSKTDPFAYPIEHNPNAVKYGRDAIEEEMQKSTLNPSNP